MEDAQLHYLKERRAAILRDDFTCQYCDAIPDVWTADHVIPRSQGGSNHRDNLVCACQACNQSKGARTPLEWYTALQSSTPGRESWPYLGRILQNLEMRFGVSTELTERRPKRWYIDFINIAPLPLSLMTPDI